MEKNISVVDIFCGIGGLTHGFVKEGIKVVAGIDNDETCKYAYEKNNSCPFISKNIAIVSGAEIKGLYPKGNIKILVGCAPCQPFSLYSKKGVRDKRWDLLKEFTRLINEVKPEIISMENVPQLRKYPIFDKFIKNLEEKGYNIFWKIVYAPDYGIPQNRKRLILLASKFGKIELIGKTHRKEDYLTVRKSIGGLEPISDGEISSKDSLHRSRKLSDLNKIRIQNTSEGGGWKDWDKKLLLKCHKKKSGKTFRGVYGRMEWDNISPTITTQFMTYGCGRYGHPEQDRAISLREGSLLQTFPVQYDFIDPSRIFSSPNLARHIGNAVPVKLGRIIAKSIKNHISCIFNE